MLDDQANIITEFVAEFLPGCEAQRRTTGYMHSLEESPSDYVSVSGPDPVAGFAYNSVVFFIQEVLQHHPELRDDLQDVCRRYMPRLILPPLVSSGHEAELVLMQAALDSFVRKQGVSPMDAIRRVLADAEAAA
jgi:hypothetical protein